MSLQEEILKKLNKIFGKYMATQGLPVWGTVVRTAQGDYRVLYVDDDGKLVVSASISGTIDVSDRWTRQVGQVDVARYLGSTIGLTNALHSQIVYGGAIIDPRSIRALTSSDIVTVNNLLNPHPITATDLDIRNLTKTLDELYAVLRTDAGVAYDARQIRALTSADVVSAVQSGAWSVSVGNFPSTYDVSDRAGRLLGIVYGSQGQQLLQRATTYDLIVQLRSAGAEIDPRSIRALTSADVVTVQGINNALPAGTNTIGNVKTLHDLATYKTAIFYGTAGGDIVPAVAGKKIKVHFLDIQAQGTVTVTIRDGSAAGARLDEWKLQDREGAEKPFVAYPANHFSSLQTAGNSLFADLSAAVTVKICVIYTDADAS